jgi:steroid delta-isomerase-like uncharacterized protein
MNKSQKQIAKEWHEAFGTSGLKNNYEKYLHPDFLADFFGDRQVDRNQYIDADQKFAAALSDNKIVVTEQIEEGNKVVSIMSWSAVHTGDLPNMPATGKKFEIKGIAIDHFKDGKVIKHYPLFDQLKMMEQLGVVHAEG